ncbi:MAG: TonB-dependent receptor [Bacteroidota bacterium]
MENNHNALKFALVILAFLTVLPANAQTTVSGLILDHKQEPVIGANVYIKDTYDGASTDLDGQFAFHTNEMDSQILVVSAIGYETAELAITLAGEALTFEVTLKEAFNRLDAVTISAGSFSAGEDSKREVLKPLDIATTAGATADIAGALNTLPGTQTVGETGRLFVRGGAGNETKTFIDGMQVLSAYSPSFPNTATRGRFSPFMFSGTSFSTGGYSAEYGQALSSALILNTKDEATSNRGDISIMSVGLEGAYTHAWERSSFAGKLQYVNIAPYFGLIPQELDIEKAPESLDGNFAYRLKLNETDMLKVYTNFNHARLTSRVSDIDNPEQKTRIDLTNNYRYVNASYTDILNDQWSLRTGVSYTSNVDDIDLNQDQVREQERGGHVKWVLAYDHSERLSVSFGSDVFTRKYTQAYRTHETGRLDQLDFNESIVAGFGEMDFYFSNRFVTRFGLRTEHNTLNNQFNLAPRLSLGYKTSEHGQVALAYGQFHQTANNDLIRINNLLENEKADHYILNYQVIKSQRTFRVEVYHKQYRDLVKFDAADIFNPTAYNNAGNGYARGLDVFWRDAKTIKGLDYWVSYSYLDTERDFRDHPISAMPTFASKHNFSIVTKYFVNSIKTQVGATYSMASSRPFYNPNLPGFNQGRTRAFQDLSVNFSHLVNSFIILHGSVTNVFGFNNVFGYEYGNVRNEEGQFNRRAITQPAPRFIFVGLFITLAKDKSINQLPNL